MGWDKIRLNKKISQERLFFPHITCMLSKDMCYYPMYVLLSNRCHPIFVLLPSFMCHFFSRCVTTPIYIINLTIIIYCGPSYHLISVSSQLMRKRPPPRPRRRQRVRRMTLVLKRRRPLKLRYATVIFVWKKTFASTTFVVI